MEDTRWLTATLPSKWAIQQLAILLTDWTPIQAPTGWACSTLTLRCDACDMLIRTDVGDQTTEDTLVHTVPLVLASSRHYFQPGATVCWAKITSSKIPPPTKATAVCAWAR